MTWLAVAAAMGVARHVTSKHLYKMYHLAHLKIKIFFTKCILPSLHGNTDFAGEHPVPISGISTCLP